MREEQQKRAAETKEDSDDEGLAGAEGGKGDFLKFLKDPEVLQAFQVLLPCDSENLISLMIHQIQFNE